TAYHFPELGCKVKPVESVASILLRVNPKCGGHFGFGFSGLKPNPKATVDSTHQVFSALAPISWRLSFSSIRTIAPPLRDRDADRQNHQEAQPAAQQQ